VLVAHNAGFDMAVIVKTSEAFGLAVPDYRSLCSLQVARKTYHLESYRLPSRRWRRGSRTSRTTTRWPTPRRAPRSSCTRRSGTRPTTIERLAHITAVPFGAIGPVATQAQQSRRGPWRCSSAVGGRAAPAAAAE
jgi:DNA polymerase-3 subunit epsilon